MERTRRMQLVLGLLLILLGAWFLAVRRIPALGALSTMQFEWPLYTVAAGAVIFLVGLATGAPRMSVPACVVSGIGGILYYQNRTGDWDSWSFLWSLIPGFVGLGVVLTGLLGEDTRANLGRGLRLLVISAGLFLVFAALMRRMDFVGPYVPSAILILLGIYVLGRGLFRPRARGGGPTSGPA